jgi:hypothetical protein
VLAAGCGTVRYQDAAGQGGTTARHGRTTAARTAAPATITRQQAERLARELLSRAPLPAGARRTTGPPVRALGRPPSTELATPSVALSRLWTVAAPMDAVNAYLKNHVPAGMAANGSGQGGQLSGVPERTKLRGKPPAGGIQPGNVGTVTEEWVSYQLRRPPAGVMTATVSMAVAPGNRGASELRADVQVIWYPPRSAAEYVPAGMHAVTITASYLSPKPGSVTRTFTSPATVQRLAALLNGAHAAANVFLGCPMWQVGYRLAFAASPGASAYLVAMQTSCASLPITVRGRAQPALQVPPSLTSTLAGLMHVRTAPGTGVMTPASGPPVTPLPACVKPWRGVWGGVPPGTMEKSPCPALPTAAP